MKTCSKCKIEKSLSEFYKASQQKSGLTCQCKECIDEYNRVNYNKFAIRKKLKHQKEPWIFILHWIKARCNNPNDHAYKDYGGRGIKNLFKSSDEVKFLYERDNARSMKRPSIDRIDNNGNYCIDNCRFIEKPENSVKDKRKSVLQFALDGTFINEFISTCEAERQTGLSHKQIGKVALGQRQTAYGYIWRYKNASN